MRKPLMTFAIVVLSLNTGVAGGIGTGGGSVIQCSADPQSGFAKDGYYALDYAIGIQANGGKWYRPSSDVDDNLKSIANFSKQKLRVYLVKDRDGFNTTLAKVSPEIVRTYKSQWKYLDFKLQPTEDVSTAVIPSNCSRQSIEQITTFDGTSYFTRPDLAKSLQQTGAEQWETHIVHEVLRQAGVKSDAIAIFNRLLHRKEFRESSETEVLNEQGRAGLLNVQELQDALIAVNNSRTCKTFYDQTIRESKNVFYNVLPKMNPIYDQLRVVSLSDQCRFIDEHRSQLIEYSKVALVWADRIRQLQRVLELFEQINENCSSYNKVYKVSEFGGIRLDYIADGFDYYSGRRQYRNNETLFGMMNFKLEDKSCALPETRGW
ncbi:hypothetical protein K2X30_12510 [bacterium]|nr:hypothetical protein [bacterium]